MALISCPGCMIGHFCQATSPCFFPSFLSGINGNIVQLSDKSTPRHARVRLAKSRAMLYTTFFPGPPPASTPHPAILHMPGNSLAATSLPRCWTRCCALCLSCATYVFPCQMFSTTPTYCLAHTAQSAALCPQEVCHDPGTEASVM